jgi:hypothetical protein
MKVRLFMENMWEFSLCFYFVPYKVNIPMYAGEFFLMFFFVLYKVNISMYAGGFKQVPYKGYICWRQVKIHISDQTSLRICNSVHGRTQRIPWPWGELKKGNFLTALYLRNYHSDFFDIL